jgi:hypothetical protein
MEKKTIYECKSLMPKIIDGVEMKRELNNFIYNGITKEINYYIPEVVCDPETLKEWVKMCVYLSSIDKHCREDFAIQKKFEEKDREIEKLKQKIKKLLEK